MNQNTNIAILAILTLTVAIIVTAQSVKAIPGAPCVGCAKDFAPGHEAKLIPGPCNGCKGSSDFAPGQEAKISPGLCIPCNGASDLAPGQLKKQPSTTSFG